jgi:hypothetical protein
MKKDVLLESAALKRMAAGDYTGTYSCLNRMTTLFRAVFCQMYRNEIRRLDAEHSHKLAVMAGVAV